MTQWDKLLHRILTISRDMRFEEVRKVLEHYGYNMESPRGGGSHHTFRKLGHESLTIPNYSPIKSVYIEKIRDIIMTDEEERHENSR